MAGKNVNYPLFSRYSKVEEFAQRAHKRGRAKGGIVIYYRNDIFELAEVIKKSTYVISLRLKIKNSFIIILCAYIQPYQSHDELLDHLFEHIGELKRRFVNDYIILCGDLNARISDNSQYFHESMHSLGQLRRERKSFDKRSNNRGNSLVELADFYEMLILNGRCIDDINGDFTFTSAQGSSVIDLALVNLNSLFACKSFKVLTTMSSSNHFPCKVSIVANLKYECEKTRSQLVWKNDLQLDYQINMANIIKNLQPPSHINMVEAITVCAKKLGMQKVYTSNKPRVKPWFDKECVVARGKMRQAHKQIKKSRWTISPQYFLDLRNEYKNTVRVKKEAQLSLMRQKIGSVKNSKDFWSSVKFFRRTPKIANEITENKWIEFYRELLPPRKIDESEFNEIEDAVLDGQITTAEIEKALKKIAINKSPGPDSIKNEFLKNLPPSCIDYVRDWFNNVFQNEIIPTEWGESETVMLYKKGDPLLPVNYRPIALLNTMFKLFTQIIEFRLRNWATQKTVIPEAQGGFREGRGCDDQIFTLNAAIQLCLQKPRGKAFVLFVDFERAFPSISHEKLYQKLDKVGVSAKIIRIIRKMYQNARTRVRTEHGETKEIEITEGLLQGEILSPLLFSLYISDIEKILAESEVQGVQIADDTQLNILLFADDTAVLSETPGDLQLKISVLEKYFKELDLKVNIAKTKVMVFRKGGRLSPKWKFFYDGKEIDIVNEYTYLGVPFASSGLFSKAARHFKQKGMTAIGSVWNLFSSGKLNAWKEKVLLFNSLALSVVLYSAHIWGLNYIDIIEQVQSNFYKKVLGCSKFVPNYILRLEVGAPKLEIKIIKQAIMFWIKLLDMTNDRYAKKCFIALYKNAESEECIGRYNWVRSMKKYFDCVGVSFMYSENDQDTMKRNAADLVLKLWDIRRQEDITRMIDSNRYNYYQYIMSETPLPASYLQYCVDYYKVKLLTQARINFNYFYFDKQKHEISYDRCNLCNSGEDETLEHLLTKCVALHCPNNSVVTKQWYDLLKWEDKDECMKFFNYLAERLKLRSEKQILLN